MTQKKGGRLAALSTVLWGLPDESMAGRRREGRLGVHGRVRPGIRLGRQVRRKVLRDRRDRRVRGMPRGKEGAGAAAFAAARCDQSKSNRLMQFALHRGYRLELSQSRKLRVIEHGSRALVELRSRRRRRVLRLLGLDQVSAD